MSDTKALVEKLRKRAEVLAGIGLPDAADECDEAAATIERLEVEVDRMQGLVAGLRNANRSLEARLELDRT